MENKSVYTSNIYYRLALIAGYFCFFFIPGIFIIGLLLPVKGEISYLEGGILVYLLIYLFLAEFARRRHFNHILQ